MIDDLQIIEAAARAQRIKEAVPTIGVSTDAIFSVIVLTRSKPGRRPIQPKCEILADPPEWFHESLRALSGRRMTIGNFLLCAGRHRANKAERNAVGRWLRATGRTPRKTGGKQLFDL